MKTEHQIFRIPYKYCELFETMDTKDCWELIIALMNKSSSNLQWLAKTYYNIIIVDIENIENQVKSGQEWGKKWGRPRKEKTLGDIKEKTPPFWNSKPKLSKDKLSEVKIREDNNIIVSKETELSLRPITNDINNLIFELKNTCDELWIAYDKKQERNFAKHILTAKEFLDFCTKIEMLPAEFAKNILRASVKIKYWKWPCAWPMMIYQNYAEVYNQTKEKKPQKTQNIVYSNEI